MKTLCFTPSQPVRLYLGEQKEERVAERSGVEVKRNKVDKNKTEKYTLK